MRVVSKIPAKRFTVIVNYRAGDGGRKAPIKRGTIGRYGRVTVEQARKLPSARVGILLGLYQGTLHWHWQMGIVSVVA